MSCSTVSSPPHTSRLIVHAGLHKTASTYLQAMLNANCAQLAERGIWYAQRPVNEPEHHPVAWALLNGDATPLAGMLRDAVAAGCHTTLFSSEELEAILFVPEVARLIEATAIAAGIDAIEWHVVLREPGSYFSSLHAQMHWHTYADSLVMFREVMTKGHYFAHEPMPGTGTRPYWYFAFDHLPQVRGFAAATQWPLFVHDYADAEPYPGWRILDRIGAMEALVEPPAHVNAANVRRDDLAVATGFCHRLIEAVGDPAMMAELAPVIEQSLRANLAAVPALSIAVGHRFGASHCAALAEFGFGEAAALRRAA